MSQPMWVSSSVIARMSAVLNEFSSQPAPEASGNQWPQGYWAHGRYYGNWKPGKYLVPIDAEELNRLDIFHKFFLVARNNSLSEQIPEVMAVDLNRIQPNFIPRGMITVQYDIEDPSWDDLLFHCDLVHLRTLLGSIQNPCWPAVYRNAFQHLTPGTGYLEQVEIDWIPRWDKESEVPTHSALNEWADRLLAALDRCNRNARIMPQETRRMIEQAGFVDFQEQTIRCYVNPWSPDPNEREAAKWFNLGLRQAVEAMGLMPMIEKLGMTAEQVKDLCHRVVEENTKLRFHGYCTM
ncbi:methyl transferase [Purpureocillium lavendulum]|uniref:Methyl transferase n=1 Tax=Purpureocillium lavendulum TaxID=1247861 RepID=A0AB34FUB2_9HYPO|nr:methyl transferase [Purpureocillium lavendulum]